MSRVGLGNDRLNHLTIYSEDNPDAPGLWTRARHRHHFFRRGRRQWPYVKPRT